MNIYVGNLSRQAGENELKALFAQFGEVKSAKIVKDQFSGESRGFAFIEMPDNYGSQAVAALDGKEFSGRSLKVNEARPKTAAKPFNSFSSNYGYKARNDF